MTRAASPTSIAIIGSPRAGKTTLALQLAAELGLPVVHSDDLVTLGWSGASEEIADLMLGGEPRIYEGVAVVRGLRKACLRLRESERPVQRCIVLEHPRYELTAGQDSMRRGCATILQYVQPELLRRGVLVMRPTHAHAAATADGVLSAAALGVLTGRTEIR